MILELKNLRFAYQETPIIDISEFKVEKGQKVFLHGPSGSGKSTLLNLVSGVLRPSAGEILFEQRPFSQLSSRKRDRIRGRDMGYIFQSFNLIPYLSVLDNVLLPIEISSRECQQNSPKKEATSLLESLGIQELRDQPVYKLSLGQQQRVAAARALIGRPKLIIADEPTSSLDYHRSQDFLKLLFNQIDRNEGTLLFVSHDDRLKPSFDRVVELAQINQMAKVEE